MVSNGSLDPYLPLEEWDINISSTICAQGDTVMLEIKYFKMSFLTHCSMFQVKHVQYLHLNTFKMTHFTFPLGRWLLMSLEIPQTQAHR